jgi:hypothetical protein
MFKTFTTSGLFQFSANFTAEWSIFAHLDACESEKDRSERRIWGDGVIGRGCENLDFGFLQWAWVSQTSMRM